MIRLQTFGGAVLFGDDGARLLGAASQRRILGLLSVLAASGEGGQTRDKLVGILWPESAPKRARHSLTQTMYAARRAVACDDLFEATEDIRLNPTRISSDVADFEAALAAGEDAVAAQLYRGPFLDGFYLSSSDFDWWLHHQRTRLEDQAVASLLRLATASEDAADWDGAAAHLRTLAAIRPSDSAVAMRLMKALGTGGDRAGAVQHAAVHARLLREQYEMEPDAEVLALAAELREVPRPADAQAAGAVAVAEPGPGRAEPSYPGNGGAEERSIAGAGDSGGPVAGELIPLAEVIPQPAPGSPRLWRGRSADHPARSLRWLAATAVIVLVTAAVAWLIRQRAQPAAYPSLDQQVVVTPFRVAGADPSLEYLRDGMVEMLSTRLADDTAARSVDAGAVLAAWRQAGITRTTDVPRDSVVRLAAKLGAQRVVVGSVVGTPARMIVSAAVLAVPSGQPSGEATVEGSAAGLAELIDQLAAKLLLVEAGQGDRLAGQMTQSLPALRAYLAGTAADARGDYALSTRQYSLALQNDSTFALAALHLAVAAARFNDYDLERQAIQRAWEFHQSLSDRDQGHLRAIAGPRYPAASNAAQAIAGWEEAARLAPNRAEVWFGLAKRILTDGPAAGLGDVRERALVALRRAAALDHNDAGSKLLLARIAGDAAPVEAPARGLGARQLPLGLFFRWWAAARRGDAAELARVAQALPAAGPANLREIAAASEFDALRPEDGARALDILARRASDGDQALGVLLAQHSLAMERGQPATALELTRRMQRLGATSRAHLRLRVLDAVFGSGDTAAAALAARELGRTASNRDLPSASADACALAQWQLARSDTAAARATLAVLQHASPQDGAATVVGAPAPVCAALVEASLAANGRKGEAKAQVARADSLVLTSAAAGDVAAFAPIVVSRLYRRLGEPARALAAIRRRPYLAAVWPRYLATELRDEATLARETGDPAGAAQACHDYLSLRSNPDASLKREVDAMRALAAELAGD